MVGVEFTKDGAPDAATCKAVQKVCIASGLLLLNCGSFDNVMRWIPPLVVTAAQIDEALAIFTKAMESV
jgi:4-aminobutyrate aminotransferase